LTADGRAARLGGIAGHSVGEITAAAGSGILSDRDAMRFVGARARLGAC
jgi:[acyl-carrier-protein] S-malonyltransferase